MPSIVSQAMTVIAEARKAVPAVKYALGLAGMAAAGALVVFFAGGAQKGVLLLSLVFIGMIGLFIFARLEKSNDIGVRWAGHILIFAVVVFFLCFLGFTITAFLTGWPQPWAKFINIAPVADATPALSQVGGTGWIYAGVVTRDDKGNWIWFGNTYVKTKDGDLSPNIDVIEKTSNIELKTDRQIILVNWGVDREKNWRDSPITIPGGALRQMDYTNVHLPAGARLEVREVSVGHYPGDPQYVVWLRIGRDPF